MTNLQPGQQLGPYQIISPIGKGGMATVYKAYHAATDRYVAVKVILNQLIQDNQFLKRFQQEARLIAKLEHPHILPIHDFGEADGIPYMVMRYLDAGTLKERLAQGPLTLAELDRIFSQLADALQYAHENGVIHRDIKPSNVMLNRRGDVFLTDFGIAKMIAGSSGLTATGAITGTPDYMSPEQAQGLKIDQRSDVYSLGIMLFEMLTGHVPFEAETPLAVLFKQIQEPPPPLSVIRPDLPYQIEPVLLKALTKNRDDRFTSIADFYAAWQQVYASIALPKEVPITPPTPIVLPVQEEGTVLPENVPPVAPAKTITTPIPTVVDKVKTPSKPKPIGLWMALGALLLITVIGGVVFLALDFVPRRISAIAATRTAQAASPASASEPTPVTTSTPETVRYATGAENVTSWTGGNTTYAILPLKNIVYSAGPGGITEWNTANGSTVQWTMRDGLPASLVPALLQSPDYAIWIGTTGGLVRLTTDARQLFTTSEGLDSVYISALGWRKNELWVGTQYCGYNGCGVQTYADGTWKAVKTFPSKVQPDKTHVSYNVLCILVDSKNRVWVGTDAGLALFDGKNNWKVFNTSNGLPGEQIHVIMEDRSGSVWAGTNNGGVVRFTPEAASFKALFDLRDQGLYDVTSILQTADDHLWFAGYGLLEYDPQSENFTSYSTAQNNFPIDSAITLAKGLDGEFYIGTVNEGLVRYKGGNIDHWKIPNVPRFTGYSEIIPAADGSLYFIDQFWNGTDRFNTSTGQWEYPNSEDISLPRAIDSKGQMWSGSYDGLWLFSAARSRLNLTTKDGLPSDNINAVAFSPSGSAWVATDGGLVALIQNVVVSITPGSDIGLDNDVVKKVFVDSKGGIWVAGNQGGNIGYLPPLGKWMVFSSYLLFGQNVDAITDFAEAANGDVLIATRGDGLYRHSPDGQWTRTRANDPGVNAPIYRIECLTIAPDGSLWLGLDDRAVRFDGETWQSFTLKDGLSGRTVYDIHVGADGSIWFATDGGVTRFEP